MKKISIYKGFYKWESEIYLIQIYTIMYWKSQNTPHPDMVASMIHHGSLQNPELTIDELWRRIFYPQGVLWESDTVIWLQNSIHGLYYTLLAFK